MKIFKTITSLFLLVLLMTSCEDFFEMSIDLDVPEHKSKLAVTTLLHNTSETAPLVVSYSISGLEDSTDAQLINNADITLSYNNETVDLTYSGSNGVYYGFPTTFTPDTNYTLNVAVPNFKSVSATQVFPKKVPIISANIDSNTLKVRFKDVPNKRNYYIIELLSMRDNNNTWHSEWIESFANSAKESSSKRGLIFNDDMFDGNQYEIVINHNVYFENDNDRPNFKVRLYSLTEDYYRYDITAGLSSYEDDPFTEPVILHRNIENGYGIFAMANKSEVEITLD